MSLKVLASTVCLYNQCICFCNVYQKKSAKSIPLTFALISIQLRFKNLLSMSTTVLGSRVFKMPSKDPEGAKWSEGDTHTHTELTFIQ